MSNKPALATYHVAKYTEAKWGRDAAGRAVTHEPLKGQAAQVPGLEGLSLAAVCHKAGRHPEWKIYEVKSGLMLAAGRGIKNRTPEVAITETAEIVARMGRPFVESAIAQFIATHGPAPEPTTPKESPDA